MWSFEHPVYLLILLFVPFLWYALYNWKVGGGKLLFGFAVWGDRRGIEWDKKIKKFVILNRVVFWVGFSLLVVGAADPSYIHRKKVYLSRAADIMIVLDESPSMSATDFQPVNRFEAAKQVIKNFIRGRGNDRIGLVAFSKRAALVLPPTSVYSRFYKALDSLKIMELGNGTAIGMGLAVALNHLRTSLATKKVIILLTDGDNNTGEILPETAAEIAYQLGVKIYTVGIGRTGETFIEFRDPRTGRLYQGLYRGNLNVELLKRIASKSGGRYLFAEDEGALKEVFERIDSEEKVKRIVKIKMENRSAQNSFIVIALMFIFLNLFIKKLIFREVM